MSQLCWPVLEDDATIFVGTSPGQGRAAPPFPATPHEMWPVSDPLALSEWVKQKLGHGNSDRKQRQRHITPLLFVNMWSSRTTMGTVRIKDASICAVPTMSPGFRHLQKGTWGKQSVTSVAVGHKQVRMQMAAHVPVLHLCPGTACSTLIPGSQS